MNSIDIKYAEKIGRWYAIAASATTIILFLLVVAVIGIVYMNFNPFQLIEDLLYIYNYGFIIGSLSALILSFIIGKSAGRLIANERKNFAKIGVLTGLAIFTPCIIIGLIVLFLLTNEADTPINVEFELRNWGLTFLFIFLIGFIPVVFVGYLYGMIVKRQVTSASLNRAEN